jgi:arginyl-tRNA--protein-N-Asp/Glu arginylyltransferase
MDVFDELTELQPYGEYASECSYCHRPHNSGRISYGVEASRMSALDYDVLLERGFIRSGSHCYAPSNARTCCPQLPIRLDAASFKPGKSHRKAMRNLNEFLSAKRTITLPEADDDPLSALLHATRTGHGLAHCQRWCRERYEDARSPGSDDDEGVEASATLSSVRPLGDTLSAVSSPPLTCLSAQSRKEKSQLKARYLAGCATREARGVPERRSDPFNEDLVLVEDHMDDARNEDVRVDGSSQSSSASDGQSAAATPAQSRADLKRERKLAERANKMHEALREYLITGVGSNMARLRERALASRGASGAAPTISAESGASSPSASGAMPPLLPFGRGPYRLTVDLVRPKMSPGSEQHELYVRFNAAIHHSDPNPASSYESHLVRSPLIRAPAHDLGFEYWCSLRGEGADDAPPPGATSAPTAWDELQRAEFATGAAELELPGLAPSAECAELLRSWALLSPEACWFIAVHKRRAAAGGGRVQGSRDGAVHGFDVPLSFDPMPALPAALLPVVGLFRESAEDMGISVATGVAIILHEAARLLKESQRRRDQRRQRQLSADLRLAQRLEEMEDGESADDAFAVGGEDTLQREEAGWLGGDSLAAAAVDLALQREAQSVSYWQLIAERLHAVHDLVTTRSASSAEDASRASHPVDASVDSLPLPALPIFELIRGSGINVIARASASAGGGSVSGLFSPSADSTADAFISAGTTGCVAASAAGAAAALGPHSPLLGHSGASSATRGGPASRASIDIVSGWDGTFGTFHQEYRLDGVLVAVSVLDILPTRIASVYFFYDPSFRYLELGKLSALVEIWLAREIYSYTAMNPQLSGLPQGSMPLCRWWDANFYVHCASTMNYKRHFHPSQLLIGGIWQSITPELLLALDDQPAGPKAAGRSGDSVGGDNSSGGFTPGSDADTLAPIVISSGRSEPPFQFYQLPTNAAQRLKSGMTRFVHGVGPALAYRSVVDISMLWNIRARAETLRQERDLRLLLQQTAAASSVQGAGDIRGAGIADRRDEDFDDV